METVASMVILVNGKQYSFCDMLLQTKYHCIAYTVDGCICSTPRWWLKFSVQN